jgi:hypothetical protein
MAADSGAETGRKPTGRTDRQYTILVCQNLAVVSKRSADYLGVIKPPNLSCSDAVVLGKRVENASRYLSPAPVL